MSKEFSPLSRPTSPEPRDLCGDCHTVLLPVSQMETFEGDRYCPTCCEAIRQGAAEFYGSASNPST